MYEIFINASNFRKMKKYTSHTIAHLTVFTRALYHSRVENLLKEPSILARKKFSSVKPKYISVVTVISYQF